MTPVDLHTASKIMCDALHESDLSGNEETVELSYDDAEKVLQAIINTPDPPDIPPDDELDDDELDVDEDVDIGEAGA